MTPAEIAAELTSIYRTPNGTMTLRDVQGLILLGADGGGADERQGGVWSNASVGIGKTLCFALLLSVIGGQRPLIFTEAANIPQMRADFERFRLHWQMPTYYRIESYDTLSNRPEFLDSLRPTFVGLDEAQCIKPYKESGRARKMDRWRRQNPAVPMACLSGSPGEDFDQYAHAMVWAVPALGSDRGGPIPLSDEGRPEGPAFRELCKRLRESDAEHEAFWARLRATPGIVISSETYTETPLHIRHTILDTPAEMAPHWERLRGDGEAPDGWVLDTGIGEQYALARMFADGMYYEHVPRPPPTYTEPRKAWFAMCRDVIEAGSDAHGGPYDTPGEVAAAVAAGRLPRGPLDAWLAVKDTYKPVTRTAWLSREPLEWMIDWGRRAGALADTAAGRGGAIIWVSHIGVGEELARVTGWPYFGDGAKDARTRRHVNTICKPLGRGERLDPVIICSTKSCATGKNLQYRYSQNLNKNPPSNWKASEQILGRTHRPLQPMASVDAEMVYGCLEDWCAYMQAESRCQTALKDLTTPPKLLLAQHDRTRYPGSEAGSAWKRVSRVEVTL